MPINSSALSNTSVDPPSLLACPAEDMGVFQSTSIVDKVRECLAYWESMNKATFAIRLIKHGLTLPFTNKQEVDRLCKRNIQVRKTSRKKRRILRDEIKSLENQRVIERAKINVPLFENYIFCVTKPSGKIRLIFDMKYLNTFIKLPQLQMFTFKKAFQSFLSNNYACKIDLSNAFWHIGINNNYKRYLSFRFDNVSYWWNSMPFGLRTAPYLFCKLMGTLIKHICTSFGIVMFYYMDDIIILAPTLDIAHAHIKIVLEEITKAGLTINFEKSELQPKSLITFLGVEIDLVTKTFVPSSDNISFCVSKSETFCNGRAKFLKDFQSLVGSLNFVVPFVRYGKLNLSPLHSFN